jgi:hypothetical protein
MRITCDRKKIFEEGFVQQNIFKKWFETKQIVIKKIRTRFERWKKWKLMKFKKTYQFYKL